MFNFRDTPIFLNSIQMQNRNSNNIYKYHFKISTKEEQLYVQDMASLSQNSIICSANALIYPRKRC